VLNLVAKPPVLPGGTHAKATETHDKPKQKLKKISPAISQSSPVVHLNLHASPPPSGESIPLRHAVEAFQTRSGSDKAAARHPPSFRPHSSRPRDRFGVDLGLRGEGFWKPPPRWTRMTPAPSRSDSPPPERSSSGNS
jgi:hypothetical protein